MSVETHDSLRYQKAGGHDFKDWICLDSFLQLKF